MRPDRATGTATAASRPIFNTLGLAVICSPQMAPYSLRTFHLCYETSPRSLLLLRLSCTTPDGAFGILFHRNAC
eukprot:3026724-Pleurochrysis_carterae.AAC.1